MRLGIPAHSPAERGHLTAYPHRRHNCPAYPLTEPQVLGDLRDCAQAAATRGTAFLEAVAFAGHLFQTQVAEAVSREDPGTVRAGRRRSLSRCGPRQDN